MNVTVAGCQQGKTSKLLVMMKDNPEAKLVTFSKHRALQLEKQFPFYKGRFISFRELESPCIGKYDQEYYVDDADLILQSLIRGKISEVTMTANPTPIRRDHFVMALEEKNKALTSSQIDETAQPNTTAPQNN